MTATATRTKRALWDISDDLHALNDLLDEVGGEVSESQAEAAIEQFFAELGNERDAKLDSYCGLIKHWMTMADVRKAEANRLADLAKSDENKAERLKSRLLQFFQIHDLNKVETARFKIARQANGGKPPTVLADWVNEHPEELPEDFRRVVFSPDLTAIAERLATQDAADYPPEERIDWASFGQRGEHIRIR